MKLFNGRRSNEQPEAFLGVSSDQRVFNLTAAVSTGVIEGLAESLQSAPPRSVDRVLKSGIDVDDLLQRAGGFIREGSASEFEIGEDEFLWQTPILRPGKILAIARNYAKHAEELGNTPPEDLAWFAKFPSCTSPHKAEITIPSWLKGEVHHEAELAVILGSPLFEANEAECVAAVAGYSVINDLTARGPQQEAKAKGMPWAAAKNLQGFCAFGPTFTPASQVAEVQALNVRCRVNSELRQEGNTSDMLFPVARALSILSGWLRLEAGDVIATGTPAGVGPVSAGDVVECEVESVALLQSFIVSGR